MSFWVIMGLCPTRGDESRCRPERSEGSAVPFGGELMQILRFAQNDTVDNPLREFRGSLLSA